MTNEIARIDDELHRAYDGDPWHGPSFRAILADVTAESAAKRHAAVAHSIWEIVAHASAWVEVVRRRLTEWRPITLTEAENFRIRPTNDVLAVRGSLKVSFGETSAWLDTTAI